MSPILDEHTIEFVSRNPGQTQRLGVRLGALLQGGDVLCLEGALGAGKTCLAQGIGRGWGIGQPLISPTFVMVREYMRPDRQDGLRLYHVDFYRLSEGGEAWGLGIDELLGDQQAVFIIEWPERAPELVPADHLWIRLAFSDYKDPLRRTLYFSARGERHRVLLQEFRKVAFGV